MKQLVRVVEYPPYPGGLFRKPKPGGWRAYGSVFPLTTTYADRPTREGAIEAFKQKVVKLRLEYGYEEIDI